MGTIYFLSFVLMHQISGPVNYLMMFLLGANVFIIIGGVRVSQRLKDNDPYLVFALLCLIAQINFLLIEPSFPQLSWIGNYAELIMGAVFLHYMWSLYGDQKKRPFVLYLNYGFAALLTIISLFAMFIDSGKSDDVFLFPDIFYWGFYFQVAIVMIYSLRKILGGDEFRPYRKMSVILNLGIGLFLWLSLSGDSLSSDIPNFPFKVLSFGVLGFTGFWSLLEKSRIEGKANGGGVDFIENFKGAVILISGKGEILNFNQKAENFLKVSKEIDLFHINQIIESTEERSRFHSKCLHILEGNVNSQFTFVGRKMDGVKGRIKSFGQLYKGNGKEDLIFLFLEDVLPLISKESLVEAFEEIYQPLCEVSSEALWFYDIQTDRLCLGEGFKNLFGLSLEKEDIKVELIKSKVHPEDRKRVFDNLDFLVLNSSRTSWENEYRFLKEKSGYAQVKSRGYIFRDSKGIPMKLLGALQDVSHFKQHDQNIQKQNAHLREIISMQSHDVREPLTRIMAIANFIMDNGYSDLGEKEVIRIIVNSCQELDRVIHQVVEKIEQVHTEV